MQAISIQIAQAIAAGWPPGTVASMAAASFGLLLLFVAIGMWMALLMKGRPAAMSAGMGLGQPAPCRPPTLTPRAALVARRPASHAARAPLRAPPLFCVPCGPDVSSEPPSFPARHPATAGQSAPWLLSLALPRCRAVARRHCARLSRVAGRSPPGLTRLFARIRRESPGYHAAVACLSPSAEFCFVRAERWLPHDGCRAFG